MTSIYRASKGVLKGMVGAPLRKDLAIGLDEGLFSEPALLDAEAAAFLAVVDDASGRKVLMRKAGPEARSGRAIGIVNLGPVDPLERFHRADSADQFQVA